jgi:5-methylcytosine-specific restriction endonuclease McrA
VDHIVRRKHGGEDDLTNLQALRFKYNANKGARDSKSVRKSMRENQVAPSANFRPSAS